MSRRPAGDERWDLHQLELDVASEALQASLPKKMNGKRHGFTKAGVEKIRLEVEAMRQSDHWERAGAAAMVALWYWCHETTYQVAPTMTGREWGFASIAAGSLLKAEFDGKAERLVDFIRWTWAEEEKSLKWRRANNRPVNPLGWRMQFSAKHVVKWRANGGGR